MPAALVYSWTGPQPIPTAESEAVPRTGVYSLSVPDHVRIADLDVVLNVRHPYTADLGVVLVAPNGLPVPLIVRSDETSGGDYRSTLLDDEALVSISEGAAPWTGPHRPDTPLSAFDGLDAQGTWTLLVTDYYPADAGEMLSWSLRVTPDLPATGVIQGRVAYDPDGDGVLPPGSPPAQGITVYLDTNGNSRRDPGEPATQSGADGSYRFEGLAVGDTFLPQPHVVALDTPAPGRITTPARASAVRTIFSADFDTGLEGFTTPPNPFAEDVNPWHLSAAYGVSSVYFGTEGTGPNANHYSSNSTGTLLSPVIDLTGQSGPVTLSFRHRLSAEISYDDVTVGVLAGGREYHLAGSGGLLAGLNNPTNGFETATVDLSAFAGQQIQVFFRLVADRRTNEEGWYVDDVAVQAGGLPRQAVTLTPEESQREVNWGLLSPVVDLVGTQFSAGQARVEWGDPVTVHYAVTNRGDGGSGPFTVQVRLADTPANLPSGAVLGSFTVAGLGGTETAGGSLTVTVVPPGGALPPGGQLAIGLVIDAGGQVSESDEGNNFGQAPLLDHDTITVVTTSTEQPGIGTLATAQLLSGPGRTLGGIGTPGEADYYRLDLGSTQRVQAVLARDGGSALQPRLVLFDAGGREIVRSDAAVSGPASATLVLPAGTYYLRVGSQTAAAQGAYTLDVDLTPAGDPQQGPPAGSVPRSVRLADVNGDGKADAVVASSGCRAVQVLLGNGDGSFQPPRSYALEGTLGSAEVADVTGDGVLDVVAVLAFDNAVAVLPGAGDGTFGAARRTRVGDLPQYLAVIGGPGPGPVYLAVSNRGSGDVSILQPDGRGGLVEVKRVPAGSEPLGLQAADVNRDGLLDVVVANSGSDTVTVLYGSHDRPFAAQKTWQVTRGKDLGVGPYGAGAADLDGDGRLDLVTANFYANTVSVLGSRSGYRQPQTFPAGLGPYAVRLADVNRDGLLDVVTANTDSDDVSVLLGNPASPGSFLPQRRFAAGDGSGPQGLDVADVNGDGWLDVVTANWYSGDLGVLLNNGDGSFLTRARVASSTILDRVLLRDLNRDGVTDLVTLNSGTADVSVLLGNGDGSFQPEQRFPTLLPPEQYQNDPYQELRYTFGSELASLSVADVNGDGRLDVLVTGGTVPGLSVLLGHGDGSFAAARRFKTAYPLSQVWVADVNGDRRSDVVAAAPFDGAVVLLQQRAGGGFDFLPPAFRWVPSNPAAVLVQDVDGDGRLDAVAALDQTNQLVVLHGLSSADQTVISGIGTAPSGVTLLPDVNGDGRPELVSVNQGSNDVAVVLSGPGGRRAFLPPVRYPVGANPVSVVAVPGTGRKDLNADGVADLITVNPNSDDVSILLGNPDGSFRPLPGLPVGRSPRSVAVTYLDGDAVADLVVARDGGDVEVYLGRGDGTFDPVSAEQGLEQRTAPRFADLDGDGNKDVVALSGTGQILFRKGLDPRNLVFAPPAVLNPGRPASDLTLVRTPQGWRVAALGRDGSTIAVYSATSRRPVAAFDTGRRNQRIAAADLNGDGLDDLVTTHPLDGEVTIVFQRRDSVSRFDVVRTAFVGAAPAEVAFSDVNGDRRVDVLINNRSSGTVTVLFNGSSQPFSTSARYATSTTPSGTQTVRGLLQPRSWEQPSALLAAPFFGGSRNAVLVVNRGSHRLVVLEPAAAGLANPAVAAPLQRPGGVAGGRPGMAATGDFNRDGLPDVAVLMEGRNEVWVYLGRGGGAFSVPAVVPAGAGAAGLSVGDVNGNGAADLLVSNGFGDVLVLLGDGRGRFKPFTRIDRETPFALADLDGDGRKDVVVASSASDRAQVFLRRGNSFVPAPDRFAAGKRDLQGPGSVKVADLNRDGLDDLIITNSGGNSLLIFPGVPGGFSSRPVEAQVGTNPVAVAVADLNGDGWLDLAVANQGSNDVAILLNTRRRTVGFSAGPRLSTGGSGPVDVRVQDVTGAGGVRDGVLDLVVKNGSDRGSTVLRGLGGGFFNDRVPLVLPPVAPAGVAPQQPGVTPEGNIFFFDTAGRGYVTIVPPSGPRVTAVGAVNGDLVVARQDGALSLLSPDGTVETPLGLHTEEALSALEILQTTTPGIYELYATGVGQLQPMVLMLDLRPDFVSGLSLAIVLQTAFAEGTSGEEILPPESLPEGASTLLAGPAVQVGRRGPDDAGGDEEDEADEEQAAEAEETDDDGTRERYLDGIDEALRELGFTVPKVVPDEPEDPDEGEDDPFLDLSLFLPCDGPAVFLGKEQEAALAAAVLTEVAPREAPKSEPPVSGPPLAVVPDTGGPARAEASSGSEGERGLGSPDGPGVWPLVKQTLLALAGVVGVRAQLVQAEKRRRPLA